VLEKNGGGQLDRSCEEILQTVIDEKHILQQIKRRET